jgi:hypothetical protein
MTEESQTTKASLTTKASSPATNASSPTKDSAPTEESPTTETSSTIDLWIKGAADIAWTRVVIPFFEWALAVFWLAMEMSKPFFAIAVAYGMLGVLTTSVTTAVSNIDGLRLVSGLPSLLCAVPLVSWSPFCVKAPNVPNVNVSGKLDSIIGAQNQLDTLVDISYATSLPMEIVATSMNAIQLGSAIKYFSDLESKEKIAENLFTFADRADAVAMALGEFIIDTHRSVGFILGMNRYMLRVLTKAHDRRSSPKMLSARMFIGRLPLSTWLAREFSFLHGPTDGDIVREYIQHVDMIYERIVKLADDGEAVEYGLKDLYGRLGDVAKDVSKEKYGLLNEHVWMLPTLWGLFGGDSRVDQKKVRKNIDLAQRMEHSLSNSSWLIANIRQELIKMRSNFKGARESFKDLPPGVATSWEMKPSELERHFQLIKGSVEPLEEKHGIVEKALKHDKRGNKLLSSLNVPLATGLGYKIVHWV